MKRPTDRAYVRKLVAREIANRLVLSDDDTKAIQQSLEKVWEAKKNLRLAEQDLGVVIFYTAKPYLKTVYKI